MSYLNRKGAVVAILGLALVVVPGAVASGLDGPGVQGKGEADRRVGFEHQGGKFLAGAGEEIVLFPGEPELEGRFNEESVVRAAYATVEQALAQSGYGVTFELSGFRTYYRRDFGKTLLRDAITLDSPLLLEITETEVTDSNRTVGRAFSPQWADRFAIEDIDKVEEWSAHFENLTVAESFREPGSELPRMPVALTSYAVTAEFDGKSHLYRAAFKWVRTTGGLVEFYVEDYVTAAVGQILVAQGEVAPVSVLQGRSRVESPAERHEGVD